MTRKNVKVWDDVTVQIESAEAWYTSHPAWNVYMGDSYIGQIVRHSNGYWGYEYPDGTIIHASDSDTKKRWDVLNKLSASFVAS